MPVKETKKLGIVSGEMDTTCALCAQKLEPASYFSHAKEVHGVFACLFCLQSFKFSQELMVHLTREHKVVSQKFTTGAEFLERGGTDTTLLCVECNKIFPSDALITYMKSHVKECRKSTGICPKCGSIQTLASLGEHMLQCQGSKNVNLMGSTTITTSQLRSRDNSCKYCGKKFSPSKIAAHMRACSVRSTKSTINVWNANRNDIIPTSNVDEEPGSVPEDTSVSGVMKSPAAGQKSSGSRRNSAIKCESSAKSSDILLPPKVSKAKKLAKSDCLPLLKPSGPRKNEIVSPQPPKLTRNDSLIPPTLFRTSPKKENAGSIKTGKPVVTRTTTSTSPSKHPPASKRTKVQSQPEPSPSEQSQAVIPVEPESLPASVAVQDDDLPPSLSPCSEEPPEEVKPIEEARPPSPPLDPLLREEDQDKRLGILVEELVEKLVDIQKSTPPPPAPDPAESTMQSESENGAPLPQSQPQPPKYEIVVNYNLDRKSDESILNDMLVKTSADCPYCRLVRLIRIDKRQLVIHMLSKHLWDIQIRQRSPGESLSASAESEKQSVPVKEEQEEDAKPASTNADQPALLDSMRADGGTTSDGADDVKAGSSDKTSDHLSPPIKMDESPSVPTTEDAMPPVNDASNSTGSSTPQPEEPTALEPHTPSLFDPPEEPSAATLPIPSLFDPPETVNSPTTTTPPSIFDPAELPASTTTPPSMFDPPEPPKVTTAAPSLFDPPDPPISTRAPSPVIDSLESTSENVGASSVIAALPVPSSAESSTELTDPRDGGTESSVKTETCAPTEKSEKGDVSATIKTDEVAMTSAETAVLSTSCPKREGGRNLAEEAVIKIENGDYSSLQTPEDDFDVPVDLTWSTFRLALLLKVFHSQNVVYTFTGEKIGEFGDRPCECLLCGFAADSQKNLFPHWRRTHRGIAMKCTMCKGRFLFAGALYSHLCLGTPEPLTLQEKQMDDEDDGNDETVGLRYQCGICENIQLPGFFNYMVHLRKDHNRCELCLEEVQNQKELEYHVKKHKLNHFCWKCNLSYCAKPNLMTHLFWKHGTESVDCSKCLKKKWPHIYHFCLPPEYFVCEDCGLYFTRPTALRVHSRLHTGEKLRKCPKTSCQERFISKKLLQKHLESVHAKVQPVPAVVPPSEIKAEEDKVEPTAPVEGDVPSEAVKVNGDTATPAAEDEKSVEPMETDAVKTEQPPTAPMDSSETVPGDEAKTASDEPMNVEDNEPSGATNGVSSPSHKPVAEEQSPESKVTTDNAIASDTTGPQPDECAAGTEKVRSPSPGISKPKRSPKPKFNLAKIQGPNLSESESDSDGESEKSSPVKPDNEGTRGCGEVGSDLDNMVNGKSRSESPQSVDVVAPAKSESPMITEFDEVDKTANACSGDTVNGVLGFEDTSSSSKLDIDGHQPFGNGLSTISLDSADISTAVVDHNTEKSKSGDEFGSMSPLLLPLEDFDFSVPEIPTFEENHLPEHIIQENALFSIQHEHDYCSPNFNATGYKRKSSSPAAYGHGSLFTGRSGVGQSPSRGRPKKQKLGSASPQKLAGSKRSRSSSSSSSSSSSCSSCGSNCSCSSSSSGSSSSSSSSSDSDSESSDNERTSKIQKSPKRLNKLKVKAVPSPSPKKSQKSASKVVNNGRLKPEKGPKGPRKKRTKVLKAGDKRQAAQSENVEPPKEEPEPEPQPLILESDLDTDDSGSEEVFHKKQLTEMIGASKPPTDEVWTMSSEKFLLKLVRGIENLEELRPPPPPPPPPPPKPGKKDRVKYSVKVNGTPQPRLKVRNVPIKPLIVKRDSVSGNGSDLAVRNSEFNPNDYYFHNSIGGDMNAGQASADSPVAGSPSGNRAKLTPRVRANQLKAARNSADGYGSPSVEDPYSKAAFVTDLHSPTAAKRRQPRSRKSGARPEKAVKKVENETYKDELYCICQSPHDNVSQMIGCDSKDCQYKWFHFECVDIVIPPKGKWFCQECREIRRKKAAARAKERQQQQQELHDA